ncbi:MAG: ZIP family metal transporter [candidate division NC10 bacterium]|nr:ZIP family metal transporter [candidate division NC10 bacterium]
MSVREQAAAEGRAAGGLGRVPAAILFLVPLLVLGAVVVLFLVQEEALVGPSPVPPDALQRLEVERVTFEPGLIRVAVRNSGPGEVTVAQVLVDEALWQFAAEPGPTIGRLGRAAFTIPYDWIPGDPVEVKLISSVGLVFTASIDIATVTPVPTWRAAAGFALLGVYAGVIPVYLGLLWLPFLRRLERRWRDLLVAMTAGILLFLGVDVMKEALAVAARIPSLFQGVALAAIGLTLGILGLAAIGRAAGADAEGLQHEAGRRALAYLVALGIGLHNMGEGLAIGTAYVRGEMALGALLVVGFTLHNATEGFGIVAPISRDRTALRHLLWMGALAGVPTVAGTLLGGFTYFDPLAVLFFALGGGAIFYVIGLLARLLQRGFAGTGALSQAAGVAAGLLLMYGTGLLLAR